MSMIIGGWIAVGWREEGAEGMRPRARGVKVTELK